MRASAAAASNSRNRARRCGRCAFASLVLLLPSLALDARGEPLLLSVNTAQAQHDPNGRPTLSSRVADPQAFGRFTQENVGHQMELRVGTRVIFKAFIREPILGGAAILTVATDAQARELAELLSNGNVKLQVDLATER